MKTFKTLMSTGIALMALMMAGSAMAYSETFSGFPSNGYVQEDKMYDNFQDVGTGTNSFLALSDAQTTIKFQNFTGYDVHTVSFTGSFAENSVYNIKYSIEVIEDSLWYLNAVGLGLDQSFGIGNATLWKRIWDVDGNLFVDRTITGNSIDFGIPLHKKVFVEDILTIGSAGVNSISNSFTQSLTLRQVPEPATLGLLAIGLAGLAIRRRAWRA